MRLLRFFLVGILFGIVLTKTEVISWYRIQEMFRFDSFHMYGIIGSAVVIGALIIYFVKHRQVRNINDLPIEIVPKREPVPRALIGGIIFGLGWAMTGACPGPIYVLIGNGFTVYLVVLLSAIFGAMVYGAVRDKLPH